MKITCDMHMHSSFSSDSDTRMEDMIQEGCRKGLSTVCFTEHMDLDYPVYVEDGKEYTFLVDMPAYQDEVFRLKEAYKDRIEVLFGIELGMQSHLSGEYQKLTERYPFDFVIASQHLLGGEDPYERAFWTGRNEKETYRQYFRELNDNLCSMEDFDTVGHLDYIVRYGPNQNRDYDYRSYEDVIEPILRQIIQRGKCLEVNTAGLKYGLGQTNPSWDVLTHYYELGGRRITVGADAHEIRHIAWEFEKTAADLDRIGKFELCIFRGRRG